MPKTLRHSILFVLFGMLGLSLHAQWQWASTISDAGNSTVRDIVLDTQDNIYVTGYYEGQLIIEDDTLPGYGGNNYDIFVAKYDALGHLLWIKTAGGTAEDQGRSIALDWAGNVYVAGSFINPVSFGNDTLTSVGWADIFLAKYNYDGNLIWAKSFGGTYADVASSLKLNNDGNLIMVGSVMLGSSSPPAVSNYDTVQLGMELHTSYGDGDIFIANVDTAGNIIWSKTCGGKFSDFVYGLNTDNSGYIYITGEAGPNKARFGNDSLINKGTYIAKFNNLGNLIWVRGIDRQTYGIYGTSVAVDSQGNVFAVGHSTPQMAPKVFASGIVVNEYAYLAKYSSSGDVLWAKGIGPMYYTIIRGLVLDADDNVYFSGYFNYRLQIAGDTINAYGSDDIFLNKYDNDGNHVWTIKAGGTGSDQGSALAMDSNGDFIVGGFTASAAAHFGEIQAGSQGMRDAFVAKYSQGNMGVVENMVGDPSFGLFPNPTSGIFSIRSDASQYTRYAVFNLQGQKLQEGNINTDITTLNLSHLPSGLYAVVLSGKDRTVSQKLNLTR